MGQEEQIKAIKVMLGKLDTMLEFDETIDVNSTEELIEKYNDYVEKNFGDN